VNLSFLSREWGAVTFVLTVLLGMVIVPVALYFGHPGTAAGPSGSPATTTASASASPSSGPTPSASASPSSGPTPSAGAGPSASPSASR
jgi:hypothetical protein